MVSRFKDKMFAELALYPLVCIYCCLSACYLPVDLYGRIASWTGNNTALHVNRASYRRLSIQIDETKKLGTLIHEIKNNSNITAWPWQRICETMQNLQFFRPFIIKRPQFITDLTDAVSKNKMRSISQLKFAYRAFGVRSISLSQYHNLTISKSCNMTEFARKKLKILIGASRASCCPHSADFIYFNETDWRTPQWMNANFPWRPDYSANLVYCTFLMHFVWKNFHKEMKMPSLESVMHLNGDEDEYQFLKTLLREYHLFYFQPRAFLNRIWPFAAWKWIESENRWQGPGVHLMICNAARLSNLFFGFDDKIFCDIVDLFMSAGLPRLAFRNF